MMMGLKMSIFLGNCRNGRRDFFYDGDDALTAVRMSLFNLLPVHQPDQTAF
jgi:hypothetical protein